MILCLHQFAPKPARLRENFERIYELLTRSERGGANLILFPDHSLSGREVASLWRDPGFTEELEEFNQKLIAASGNAYLFFGTAQCERQQVGRRIIAARHGKLIGQFDEAATAERSAWLSCTVGDELWSLLPLLRDDAQQRAEWRTSCPTPEKSLVLLWDRQSYGESLRGDGSDLPGIARDYNSHLVAVSSVGIENRGKVWYSLAGRSSLYSKNGEPLALLPPLQESSQQCDLSEISPVKVVATRRESEEQYFAISDQIRSILSISGYTKVAVGASGGIDSAVTAALFCSILSPENVLLINMPSRYNSEKTKELAKRLADRLCCWYSEIPIEDSYELTQKELKQFPIQLGHHQKVLSLTPFQNESVQARDRGSRLLAAFSAAFGALFSCNSNKTELTVGYSTLYGDLAGFFAPLGDLWKHQVYALGRYLNESVYRQEVIPWEIFNLLPSAELSPEQSVDEGKGDPLYYPYHDALFRFWVEEGGTPLQTVQLYSKKRLEEQLSIEQGMIQKVFPSTREWVKDLERWWKAYRTSGAVKRIQAPPLASVSAHPLGLEEEGALLQFEFSEKYLRFKESLLKE